MIRSYGRRQDATPRKPQEDAIPALISMYRNHPNTSSIYTSQLLVHIGSILLGLGIGRRVDAIKCIIPSPSADSAINAAAAAADIMLKDKDKTVSMGDEEYRPSAVNTAMFLKIGRAHV